MFYHSIENNSWKFFVSLGTGHYPIDSTKQLKTRINTYDSSVWGEYTPDDEVIVERGTWKTADGKLYMTDSEGTETALYNVSGNKLTLTSTSGVIVKMTYTRVADNSIDKYLK